MSDKETNEISRREYIHECLKDFFPKDLIPGLLDYEASIEGKFNRSFGEYGKFHRSFGFSIYDKKMYIADFNNKCIMVYSSDGTFLNKLSENNLCRPIALTIYKNQIYIINETNISDYCIISVYDLNDFKFICKWKLGYARLSMPRLVIHEDAVYVSLDRRVNVYSLDGKILRNSLISDEGRIDGIHVSENTLFVATRIFGLKSYDKISGGLVRKYNAYDSLEGWESGSVLTFGNQLISYDGHENIIIFDIDTGKILKRIKYSSELGLHSMSIMGNQLVLLITNPKDHNHIKIFD
jgi:hypothetical protein